MPNELSTQAEGVSRPVRRRFSDREKLRILDAADACTRPGEVGLLRSIARGIPVRNRFASRDRCLSGPLSTPSDAAATFKIRVDGRPKPMKTGQRSPLRSFVASWRAGDGGAAGPSRDPKVRRQSIGKRPR